MTLARALIAVILGAFVVGCPWLVFSTDAQEQTAQDKTKFFETQVLPLLQANCFSCHGGDKRLRGGLSLTSRELILKGGDSGPAVLMENPERSLLLQAVRHQDPDLKMPPKGKLPQSQIELLARWVKMGLPWSATKTIAKSHGPPQVDDQARSFWSFRPVSRPELPAVKNRAWVRTPVDAFILSKLESAGLEANPPAAKTKLLRRVYYDLIGLPPTREEVQAFVQDTSPDAYRNVVEKLLASPHYGERWARHWLDLVRYAETNSFERDSAKPFIWRYRDYVIRSFNEDKPYDQFLREQLAGDELTEVTADSMVATGYYRLGLWDDEPADPLLALYDELDDIIGTTSQVFLGLTANCARCHDHKIDPFPQKDYYRLLAFFHGFQRYGVRDPQTVAKASLRPIVTPETQVQHKETLAAYKKRLADLSAEMTKIEDGLRPHLQGGEIDDFKFAENRLSILKKHVSPEQLTQYQTLHKEKTKLEKSPPPAGAMAMVITEIGKTPRETFVLQRGNPHNKGDKVDIGFPSVLTSRPAAEAKPQGETAGRRRVLAEWIAGKDNPLTARVMVNRIWQYHFGRGIVRSSSDFGYQGTPPTHPELLDWLASEFVNSPPLTKGGQGGWSIKHIHRLIVLSNAYQMSSQPRPEAVAKDPENDLFWRFDLRRLSAEEIRDSVLAASGNINLSKMGGPSIYPEIPKEVLAGQSQPGLGWSKSSPEEAARRSIYVHIKRSLAVPMLAAFDAPDPDSSCPVRFTTTQPTQALGLINSKFMNDQAGVFAQDLRTKAGADAKAQVRLALWRTCQREPTTKDIERGVNFLEFLREHEQLSAEEALRQYCLLTLNLNEFVFLD